MFNPQTILAATALVIMGGLSAALIFHEVPAANKELVTFALGAIAGALTVGAGSKVADKISAPNATLNAPEQPPS